MKKKYAISLLLAMIVTIFSFNVMAAEVVESDIYDTMLISEDIKIISPAPTTFGAIKVQLDGQYLDFTDENGNVVNPEIINDRTMVPMRKIFEAFDAQIKWDGETRTVVANTSEKEITLTIDNEKAKVKNLTTEEEKEITLDAAPLILNDRTMVPVRFIAESLEKEVGWDADYRTVIIIDFDKLTKKLEEKTPALKEMFELELDTVESFKTNSKITGKLIYKDPEVKSNNEKVEIAGNLELNMNKEKEFEMYINLEFKGKGTIYNSLKEAGYEEIEMKYIIADDSAYMMMNLDGNESWINLGSDLDLSAIENMQITNSPKSYEEFMETIKVSLEELNISTYFAVEQMIEMFATMFDEDNLTITGNDSKKTVKYEMDIVDIIKSLLPSGIENIEDVEIKILVTEKIANKKVETAEVSLEMNIEEPTTKEQMEIELDLDMKYTNVNKDFDIKLPNIKAE